VQPRLDQQGFAHEPLQPVMPNIMPPQAYGGTNEEGRGANAAALRVNELDVRPA